MSNEPDLGPGASGDDVTNLQRHLTDLGYYSGSVDGQYGDTTEDAVRRLQEAAGQDQNGSVDEHTWAAIEQQQAGNSSPAVPDPEPDTSQTAPTSEDVAGQLSADGQWQWDGTQWLPVGGRSSTTDADPASTQQQLSPDGQWSWDGTRWQPVNSQTTSTADTSTADTGTPQAADSAQGPLSADGQWQWDGTQWLPAGGQQAAMMTAGSQISETGTASGMSMEASAELPAELSAEAASFPPIAGEGFGSGLTTSGAGLSGGATNGTVVVGEVELGEGTFTLAEAGQVVLDAAAAPLASGPVTIDGEIIVEEAIVASSEVAEIAGVAALGGPVVLGAAVIGTLVVLGVTYLVVHHPSSDTEPASAPGTDQTPATAPGQPAEPVTDPGDTTDDGPIVDDPETCREMILSGDTHRHHIFPRQFNDEFIQIGIRINRYTVRLPANQHIGRKGLHVVFDWNGEWHDFFADLPTTLTKAQRQQWQQRAFDYAAELMNGAGIEHLPIESMGGTPLLP